MLSKVLVVDDSPVDRRLAGRLIEKLGDIELFYAPDGKAALDQVAAHFPDLVVTDMQMPELDGFGLVEALKHQYPLIPVVLMTAAGSEAIAAQALLAGAASYVPKSALADDLADVCQRVLAMSHARRSQARLTSRIIRSTTDYELENERELLLSLSSQLHLQFTALRLCPESEALRIGIALEEALLNAFYHGNLECPSHLREADGNQYEQLAAKRGGESPYRERRIHVTVSLSPTEALWTIRDEGPGFDVRALPDPTDPEYLERPHGRGLLLMRTFMSEVAYNDRGNEVRMVKRKTTEPHSTP